MGYLTSGNEIVDAVGKFNISGNIIPQIWYRTITRTNGKPYLLAITLLSDIVYWYRPTEVRDEGSGQIVGLKKKFYGDFLQKSYSQYSELFGESKRSIKAALDRLEELGIIKKHFRDITCDNGIKIYNLMYIELISNKFKEITYPEKINDEIKNEIKNDKIEAKNNANINLESISVAKSNTLLQNFVPPYTKESNISYKNMNEDIQSVASYIKTNDTLLQNFVPPYTKASDTLLQNIVPPYSANCETNTENITKNIYNKSINHINQKDYSAKQSTDMKIDEMDMYTKIIKEKIEYSSLIVDFNESEVEILNELLELMIETIVIKRDFICIGNVEYPYQFIKNRLMKIDNSCIKYVINCLQNTTSKIYNIRAYMLTTLFNAPVTINNFYMSEVSHDIYGNNVESSN